MRQASHAGGRRAVRGVPLTPVKPGAAPLPMLRALMLQEIVMARDDDDVSVPLGDDWLALWVNFQRSLLGGWATQMGALGGWGACW